MKYYFPLHFDGGNRGCEGIAKGTATILDNQRDNLVGYCSDVPLDIRLGIDKFVTLQEVVPVTIYDKIAKNIEAVFSKMSRNDLIFKYMYRKFLNQISKDDIMVSTGGDMMCYGNNMVNTTNNILHKRGVKTILWGCSMGKENETPEKIESLKNFSLIYARESLTYEYFKSLGLGNVVCYPDPAFVLEPEKVELPSIFNSGKNVIGINISPYVLKNNDISSPFGIAVHKLLDYILNETDCSVLLIPHVMWEKQDDRVTAAILKDLYPNEDRLSILDSGKLNYMQIRYVISNCSYFIGARTHAVISAYSTCVPTLAIGYSIKAKGIAKDIGMPYETLVDSTKQVDNYSLISAFKYLEQNKNYILEILQSTIPEYIKKPFLVRNNLLEL